MPSHTPNEQKKRGGLMGFLGNLASNPMVQGAGMAGAFGFNPLLGILAGPAFATSQREAEADELALEQARRSQAALDRLPGLLGQTAPLAAGATPEEQAAYDAAEQDRLTNLQGVLASLSPEAYVTATLNPPRDRGVAANLGAVAEYLQTTGKPELTREEIMQIAGGGTDLDGILKRLQIQGLIWDQNADRREQLREDEARESAVLGSITNITNLAEAYDDLEDSLLAPGFGAIGEFSAEAARTAAFAARLAGNNEEAERIEKQLEAVATANKGVADLAINILTGLESAGVRPSVNLQRIIEDSLPHANTPVPAARKILADILAEQLKVAKQEGYEITDQQMTQYDYVQLQLRGKVYPTLEEAEAARASGALVEGDEFVVKGDRKIYRVSAE